MISNQMPGLNFDLGETADLLRDSVRSFAADHIAPRAAQIDQSNEFPADLWPLLGDLGLHGITVDEEFGGAGMGYTEHVVAVEERAGDAGHVALDVGGRTVTGVIRGAEIAAGAGVERASEHETGGIGPRDGGARDGDEAVFERLAEDL